MINIDCYLQKLERLREYMGIRIDNQPFDVWMDMQVCQTEWYIKNGLPIPQPYKTTIRFAPTSFDEFLINKYTKLSWGKSSETQSH